MFIFPEETYPFFSLISSKDILSLKLINSVPCLKSIDNSISSQALLTSSKVASLPSATLHIFLLSESTTFLKVSVFKNASYWPTLCTKNS